MNDAEEIFAKIPEPEFWGSWLLSDMRRGVDDIDWNWSALDIKSGEKNAPTMQDDHGISIRVSPWERGLTDTRLFGQIDPKENRKELLFEKMDWSADAIEQIKFLLSIIPRFREMLTEDPNQGDYWAYAKPQRQGSKSEIDAVSFLKPWLRFITDHTGHGPAMGSLRGRGTPSPEKVLRAMNPAMRLGFLTACTMFPDMDHKHVAQAQKDTKSDKGWWVDPNG